MSCTEEYPWLKNRIILYVLAGSRAYGTHTQESDYDYRGICVPPEEYRLGFLKHFEQFSSKSDKNEESVVYDIRKYFKLATEANPGILELLWTEDEDVVEIDECGKLLRENRDLFLSKKVLHTYRGYAMSQLKRVETHRRWLLNPPDHQPTRKEYDIERERGISSEQVAAALTAIKNKMDSWEIDFGELDESSKIYINEQIQNYLLDIDLEQKFRTAGTSLGFDNNFIEYLNKERIFKQALTNYNQYEEWKKNRNPKRAELEAKYGADLKHLGHLIRLMKTCREILTEGKIYVRRPDAAYLKDVRNGKYTYEEIVAWAKKEDEDLIKVAQDSKLPHHPDRNKLDELCVKIIKMRG